MKKNYLIMGLLSLGLAVSFTACSDDDDDKDPNKGRAAADIVYSSNNAKAWGNYMRVTAQLLKNDASTLYNSWLKSNEYDGTSYMNYFMGHNNKDFNSALDCVEQIIDGCTDIASEVGSSKIGDPIDLYNSGDKQSALYAVESWYSWHSIEDYSNNIRSIRNAYFGSRDGSVNSNSLSKLVASKNSVLDEMATKYIMAAIDAIENIPSPFRNHINSQEAIDAAQACGNLEEFLDKQLKPWIHSNNDINTDEVLDPIVEQYVMNVVLPTYSDLQTCNNELYEAVVAFQANPSNAAFETCAKAWLKAREPWETSEAFLYGPVADKGLDPNMDSWPLDQAGIVEILNSQNWNQLEWTGEFDEDSEDIANAQGLRGFHTLEFLIFKDGKARKTK